MGSIFGGITDAIGLTDYAGEERAEKAATASREDAVALSKEQIQIQRDELEFQKEQYEDWDAIYGVLQENLGDYYNNLDPDEMTSLGLQNQQREYQEAVKLIERDAAHRGISGSGIEFATKSSATFQNAEARARIRTDADKKVAEEQLGFLGVGLGQGTQMLSTIAQTGANVNSAYSTGVGMYTTNTANYLKQQTQFSLKNQETVNSLVSDVAGYGSSKGYF